MPGTAELVIRIDTRRLFGACAEAGLDEPTTRAVFRHAANPTVQFVVVSHDTTHGPDVYGLKTDQALAGALADANGVVVVIPAAMWR